MPAFDRPPVAETALGVEFLPITGWGIPHFGLLWDRIRRDYPKFQVQPPLGSQIEQFGKDGRPLPNLTIEFGEPSRSRCWFFHKSDSQLLQVQDSRFILNWRKVTVDAEYPHYKQLRPCFETEWRRFASFLEDSALPVPTVVQCEVTYVNIIPQGEGWATYAELPNVLKAWAGKTAWLPTPENVSFNTRFVMPGNQGRFHVALQPVIRNADAASALQLTLTARGQPSNGDLADVLAWFDLGHEWIVRGFTDLTTDQMHKAWGRTA
jgi:uncharacterized protein (TIGR04255 family)